MIAHPSATFAFRLLRAGQTGYYAGSLLVPTLVLTNGDIVAAVNRYSEVTVVWPLRPPRPGDDAIDIESPHRTAQRFLMQAESLGLRGDA